MNIRIDNSQEMRPGWDWDGVPGKESIARKAKRNRYLYHLWCKLKCKDYEYESDADEVPAAGRCEVTLDPR
jgi:hypothetical protein